MVTFSLNTFVVFCLIYTTILIVFTFLGYAFGRTMESVRRDYDRLYTHLENAKKFNAPFIETWDNKEDDAYNENK